MDTFRRTASWHTASTNFRLEEDAPTPGPFPCGRSCRRRMADHLQHVCQNRNGFTPFWICDDCGPALPGNIGITSLDAIGDFNAEPSYRPIVLNNNYKQRSGDRIWNPDSFGLPRWARTSSAVPRWPNANLLWGPGTWGVNLGLHKDFHVTERLNIQLGADVDNVFNHPLFSPDSDYGGGGGPFSLLEISTSVLTRTP